MADHNSSKLGLIKKALYIWAVQYHFVIPKEILKGYIHKFRHESENISKYGQRYYDPSDSKQYDQWLSFQEYDQNDHIFEDITYISKTEHSVLDLHDVKTTYVCLTEYPCHFYDAWNTYLHQLDDNDIIYFDSDLYIDDERKDPSLKPDFSYNTLRGFNYIGNLIVIKTEVLKQFEGQEINIYRFLLELSDQNITWKHISRILYGDTQEYPFDIETVKQYHQKNHIIADIQDHKTYAYVSYPVVDDPLVSVIIPTKDGKEDLQKCIDSAYQNQSYYPNFEIIIIDNNSNKQETFDYFDQLKKEHDNILIHRMEVPFNFSLLNNEGVKLSKGEYVLLLNNDTEVITPDYMKKMVSFAQRDNIGSVGVKLYYGDDSIQHGGVITGKGGGFAHRYYRKPHDEKGYMHTLDIPNDVSASTAACLMLSKKKYLEVSGMNEELAVQFNDVDLQLKLLEKGYFNVFLPDVELHHYESKSRGIDKEKSAVERYVSEVDYAKEHYAKWLEHDPFYNDQFDKNYDYMLKVGTGSN